MDIPVSGSSCPLFAGWIGIWNVGFVKGENQRHQRKTLKASTRTNNKLNPHVHAMPALQNQTQVSLARGECPSPFALLCHPYFKVSINRRLKKKLISKSMSTCLTSYFKLLFLYTQVKETNSNLSGFLWLGPIHTFKKLGQCLEIKGK